MLLADGRPKPSSQHSPHHIVPGLGRTRFANLARVLLHRIGIRINDPDNGVWLPMYRKFTPHWSMPEAKGHIEYHTNGYERWIYNRIRIRTGEAFIRMELRTVASLMETNTLPDETKKT